MRRIVICFFCMAFAPPRLAQAQMKALEPIKIGYSGIGIAHDFLKLMEKNRIFEKYGLELAKYLYRQRITDESSDSRRQHSIHHL